jgi:hypothetical protein
LFTHLIPLNLSWAPSPPPLHATTVPFLSPPPFVQRWKSQRIKIHRLGYILPCHAITLSLPASICPEMEITKNKNPYLVNVHALHFLWGTWFLNLDINYLRAQSSDTFICVRYGTGPVPVSALLCHIPVPVPIIQFLYLGTTDTLYAVYSTGWTRQFIKHNKLQ